MFYNLRSLICNLSSTMFLRIIEMLIGNVFITIVSIKLFRIIRSRINYLDIPIFGFIWIYTASFYTLVIGIFGLLNSHKIAIISLIGLLIVLIFHILKKSPLILPEKDQATPLWKNQQQTPPLEKHKTTPPLEKGAGGISSFLKKFRPSLLEIILCFLALTQLIRIIIHIWYIPPYVWDTMVYHLVNVAEWVQKGRIFAVTTPVDRVYWPASFELLEAWFVVFLHNDLLVKVAPFLYYLLTGASAYAIARTIKLNRSLSMSVVIFYLFTPSLAIQATACKNDVGISAIYLLSIAILLDLLINSGRENFPLHRQLMIVLMAQCLGIGIKPYAAFIAPAPLIISIITILKHRKNPPQSPFQKGEANRIKELVKSQNKLYISIMLLLIISSLFLGSYWYARNFVVFGNPVHPTDFRLGDRLIFGTGNAVQFGPGQRGSASLTGLLENLKSLVKVRIFDKSGAYNSSLGDMTGWGWFNFACGLSAIIYALIFIKYLRLMIISFFISLVGLLTFISIDPWFMRFTMWFPVIFALSFACLISNLNYKWLRAIFLTFAIICTLLNWIAVLNVGEVSIEDFQKMMSLPALKRSTAELTHHQEGMFKKALEIIPENKTIGVCFPNNGWAYPLYDSDYSRHLEYVPVEDMQFAIRMRERNINYLVIERITPEQIQLIEKAFQAGYLTKIEEFLYALFSS